MFLIALLLQAVSTLGAAGIAWYRILVQLPLLRTVDRRRRGRYLLPMETLEQFLVAPLLLLETLSTLAVLFALPGTLPMLNPLAGFALLAFLWVLQLTVARPRLHALVSGFSARHMRALLCAVRLQACAWTLRAALVLMLILRVMQALQ